MFSNTSIFSKTMEGGITFNFLPLLHPPLILPVGRGESMTGLGAFRDGNKQRQTLNFIFIKNLRIILLVFIN